MGAIRMNHDDICYVIDKWIAKAEPKEEVELEIVEQIEKASVPKHIEVQHTEESRRGIGVSPKTAIVLFGSLFIMLIAIASASLITSFATINANVTVSDTALHIEGENAPYTTTITINDALPGDKYYKTVNFTNIRDDCYFDVNYTVITDEGLHCKLFNESMVEIQGQLRPFRVYASETRYLTIEWSVDLLAGIDDYTGTITFVPEGAHYIEE